MGKFQISRSTYRRFLIVALWLIAAHSIGFGLALIVMPGSFIEYFGFTLPEKFFAVQGGVFHLIISFAYITAALDPEGSRKMVFLAVFTKFSATVFLFGYYLFEKSIPMVLMSGILDFLMGLTILILYLGFSGKTGVTREGPDIPL